VIKIPTEKTEYIWSSEKIPAANRPYIVQLIRFQQWTKHI